jgi:hypothetical protein
MISKLNPEDYSFVVRRRGTLPKPWRWEIYRAGKSDAVERSVVFFESMSEAARKGKKALADFLGKPLLQTEAEIANSHARERRIVLKMATVVGRWRVLVSRAVSVPTYCSPSRRPARRFASHQMVANRCRAGVK